MVTRLRILRVAFGSRLHSNRFLHLSARDVLVCWRALNIDHLEATMRIEY